METFLLLWIREKRVAGDTKEFFGTKRWFTGFRKRNGLHSVVRHGEAASGERDAGEQHHEKFKKIIEEGSFDSQQGFNCDETGLFWKRMPCKTCITKETGHLAWP